MRSNQNRIGGRKIWLTPVLLALPIAAVMLIVAFKYGTLAQKLIQVAVKLAVIK